MLKIGLTGGIACGKSTISKIFEQLNIPVIDADEIAQKLVAFGKPALVEIQKAFNTDILNTDGSLNRQKLKEIIFTYPAQKQKLEKILHPLIYASIETELQHLNTPYCIMCIPLLLETNMCHLVDRILVVDCTIENQINRLKKRDNISLERIQSIISSQASQACRKTKAHDLINNSETNNRLAEQVKKLNDFYLSISTC